MDSTIKHTKVKLIVCFGGSVNAIVTEFLSIEHDQWRDYDRHDTLHRANMFLSDRVDTYLLQLPISTNAFTLYPYSRLGQLNNFKSSCYMAQEIQAGNNELLQLYLVSGTVLI